MKHMDSFRSHSGMRSNKMQHLFPLLVIRHRPVVPNYWMDEFVLHTYYSNRYVVFVEYICNTVMLCLSEANSPAVDIMKLNLLFFKMSIALVYRHN